MCNVYDVDGRFYLVDLPGYGYARVSKTLKRGFTLLLRDYISNRPGLVGIVWLMDLRRDPSSLDLEMADLLEARGVPVLLAATKADKVGRGYHRERTALILEALAATEDQLVLTSSKTSEGIDALRDSVNALVDARQ